jgi:hypothetical protein
MKTCSRKTLVTILALVGMTPTFGWANGEADGGRRPPPQQAIDACSEKSEGTTVELTTPRGHTMKAVCKQIGAQLVAVPERMGQGPGNGGPPKEERN